MGIEKNYEDWAEVAEKLHALAQKLLPQSPKVELRIPRVLADEAVAAWQRDEDPGELSEETDDQRSFRDDAATFALIGLAIEDSGFEDADEVIFKLDAWILGNSLEAADRAGRLDLFPPEA